MDSTQVFTLRTGMNVAFDANDEEVVRTAHFLQQWVAEQTGLELVLAPADDKAAIRLVLIPSAKSKKKGKKGQLPVEPSPQQQEAYMLTVDASGIMLEAQKPVGLFRAAQT